MMIPVQPITPTIGFPTLVFLYTAPEGDLWIPAPRDFATLVPLPFLSTRVPALKSAVLK
jgi:hypothetical protein